MFSLNLPQELLTEEQEWGRRYARTIQNDSDDELEENPGPEYEVNVKNVEGMTKLISRQCLFRPILDTYTITAMSMELLVDKQIPERDLMKQILNEIQSQLEKGLIQYAESVSTDSIKNALKLLERWGVVECHTQDRIKLYYLSPDFDEKDSLQSVVNYFGQFKIDFICDDSITTSH